MKFVNIDGMTVNRSVGALVYEFSYQNPNGDPHTGMPRYDEESQKGMVSDVATKRVIRDAWERFGFEIYVSRSGDVVTSAARVAELMKDKKGQSTRDVILQTKDGKMNGFICTVKKESTNATGAIQYDMLNSTINKTQLMINQNTSAFSSSDEKTQGSIGTSYIIPYGIPLVIASVDPFIAHLNGVTEQDITDNYSAWWYGIGSTNTRSRNNQNPLFMIRVEMSTPYHGFHNLRDMIKIKPNADKEEFAIRSMTDYEFDFMELENVVNKNQFVQTVYYYTENEKLENIFQNMNKFEKMKLSI